MGHSIVSDKSLDDVRNESDFAFLPEIKKLNASMADEFMTRVSELRRYATLLETHQDMVDEARRPQLFSRMSYAYRRASESVSWALFLRANALRKIKYAFATAYHDRFYDYQEEQKTKDRVVKETDKNREAYVKMDKGYQNALYEEAIVNAILEQFMTLKMEFMQGQASLKAMYYGNKDSSHLNSAASNWTLENDND